MSFYVWETRKENEMKKFYFTFGIGHALGKFYQVIFAKSEVEANRKMVDLYGDQWAFCYNAEQWAMSRSEGYFKDLMPFKPIQADEEVACR